MSTDKTTARPWDVFAPHQLADSLRIFSGTHYIGSIGNSDDEVEITNANAALIVKAVNLHDELVHACEKALERLEAAGLPYTSLLEAVLAKVKED